MMPQTPERRQTGELAPSDESEPPGVDLRLGKERFVVLIANEQALLAIDEGLLYQAIRQVLASHDEPSASISVAIVDDATMRPLNRQFLEHDYTTDVLSFGLNDEGEALSGELIVNTEYAMREAADHAWPPHNELLLYVVHGTLHLVGYCDKSEVAALEMRAAEKDVLATLGIEVSPTDSRWATSLRADAPEVKGTAHS